MKQATYVREQYPDAEIHIFYIDVRSPGRMEDFYTKVQEDEKFIFHRGKVGKITESSNNSLILEAENTLTGEIEQDGSRSGGPRHGHGPEHGRGTAAIGYGPG